MSAHSAGASAPSPDAVQAKYFVTACAEPGVAPRLVEPFAKLGLTPVRLHLSTEDGKGEDMFADMRLADVDRTTAHLIDKALRRVVGVRQVITLVE